LTAGARMRTSPAIKKGIERPFEMTGLPTRYGIYSRAIYDSIQLRVLFRQNRFNPDVT